MDDLEEEEEEDQDDHEEPEEEDEEDAPRGKASPKPKAGRRPSARTKKNPDKTKGARTEKKAGICFPVNRIRRMLKESGYAKSVRKDASIYLTGVIEYVVAEILELAGNSAKEQKKARIIPRNIQLAIRNDEELNKYMSDVTIKSGGVLPNVHTALLPDKQPTKGVVAASFSQEY